MPYKEFTDGEVLDAAEVNTYFMNQSVLRFSTEAARNAAIITPIEGMLAYITSNSTIYIYNGTTWTAQVATVTTGAVTTDKLDGTASSEAVTTAKIRDGAVTTAKLGSGLTLAGTTTLGGATVINEIFEIATVVGAQPVATDGGTLSLDISSGAVYYYTTSTTRNIVLDIATTGFSTGQVATVVVMVTSGGAAGKISAIKIDTVLQASQAAPNTALVKWFGGTSFPNGTGPSTVDVYTLSIFKTGATDYTTFASQSKFA